MYNAISGAEITPIATRRGALLASVLLPSSTSLAATNEASQAAGRHAVRRIGKGWLGFCGPWSGARPARTARFGRTTPDLWK